MTRRRPRGFTLVELFLVMVLIAILTLIALPFLRGAVARADAARVRADVRQVELAAAQYREEHGGFPGPTEWGEAPPGMGAWMADGTRFTYKELDYRLVPSGEVGAQERFDVQVRYSETSRIGEALQAFRGDDVVWTRTRTTFLLFP